MRNTVHACNAATKMTNFGWTKVLECDIRNEIQHYIHTHVHVHTCILPHDLPSTGHYMYIHFGCCIAMHTKRGAATVHSVFQYKCSHLLLHIYMYHHQTTLPLLTRQLSHTDLQWLTVDAVASDERVLQTALRWLDGAPPFSSPPSKK